MAILPPTSPTTFSGGFSFGRRAEMLQNHSHSYQIKSYIKLNSLSVLMKYNNGSHTLSLKQRFSVSIDKLLYLMCGKGDKYTLSTYKYIMYWYL